MYPQIYRRAVQGQLTYLTQERRNAVRDGDWQEVSWIDTQLGIVRKAVADYADDVTPGWMLAEQDRAGSAAA
jgi:hypothetical protein